MGEIQKSNSLSQDNFSEGEILSAIIQQNIFLGILIGILEK